MLGKQPFTRYRPIDDLLAVLMESLTPILGSDWIGMYVHGSLALGEFDPNRSDLDYVVITAHSLPSRKIVELEKLHERILNSDLQWKSNIEGSYIPVKAIRRHDPADSVHPAIRADGSFGLDQHGSEWIIQRHVIREKGIVLSGPDPKSLIDPISPTALRLASTRLLVEWWEPQLQDPHRLLSSEYQSYAVLTMCRVLYTIAFGKVASKMTAAKWAKETFSHWSLLIDKAMGWQHGVQLHCLKEVQRMIMFTLEAGRLSP